MVKFNNCELLVSSLPLLSAVMFVSYLLWVSIINYARMPLSMDFWFLDGRVNVGT